MNTELNILEQLDIQELSKQNKEKYYKFVVYGRPGTGKTTTLTRENNALVLDINEDGTTVVEQGLGASIVNFNHLGKIIQSLPAILAQARNNGQPIDIVVIETLQKLRDITLDQVMKGKTRKPQFADWGEVATRIISMYRFVSKLQQEHKFHFAITGHEGNSSDKREDGTLFNPSVTIKAQDSIRDAVISQSDVLARTYTETDIKDGERSTRWIFSVEPSEDYETKVRHSPSVTLNNKKFENASLSMLVDAIRNGN
ncbi:chromosomal replication initiator DnaA [Staphylococcus rostri]|uniref:Chromosomal replication initiator DnaA n=1 Tax=Staphylococcus rostri TaxID=522262 RepID=A0A2K3YGS2_9STAP|nr:AAA family ATPase [Staphylococcus rostri]PNZ24801.1 chromosomal replication initiator DnaA [Staphylococcus rostri]